MPYLHLKFYLTKQQFRVNTLTKIGNEDNPNANHPKVLGLVCTRGLANINTQYNHDAELRKKLRKWSEAFTVP